MNNRKLLLFLVILLAVYGLTRLFSSRPERSFQAELIRVDTSEVTSIVIDPKAEEEEIILKREAGGWIATQGERNTRALPSAVDGILANLGAIRTRRIAAKSPGQWEEYEVDTGQSTRVRLYREGNLLEDFHIGRFSFDQERQSATSHIRLEGEDEVYAVDGFRLMDFDGYRDKSVLKLPAGTEVERFSWGLPDTVYHFLRTGGGWTLNDTLSLDPIAVTRYLNNLRNLAGETFADDFDELQTEPLDTFRLTLESTGLPAPLTVTAFRDTLRKLPYVIRSDQNPDAFFASDSAGLYRQLFWPVERFLPEE